MLSPIGPSRHCRLDPAIHLLRKKRLAKDGPTELGFTRVRHLKCASRINPTCVVKPAGDAGGWVSTDSKTTGTRFSANNRLATQRRASIRASRRIHAPRFYP